MARSAACEIPRRSWARWTGSSASWCPRASPPTPSRPPSPPRQGRGSSRPPGTPNSPRSTATTSRCCRVSGAAMAGTACSTWRSPSPIRRGWPRGSAAVGSSASSGCRTCGADGARCWTPCGDHRRSIASSFTPSRRSTSGRNSAPGCSGSAPGSRSPNGSSPTRRSRCLASRYRPSSRPMPNASSRRWRAGCARWPMAARRSTGSRWWPGRRGPTWTWRCTRSTASGCRPPPGAGWRWWRFRRCGPTGAARRRGRRLVAA